MTRATRLLSLAIPLSILYFLALFDIIAVPLISTDAAQQILPTIPWWCLVTFGSYSLGSLGLGLVRFRDCPEAYEELLKEINQAKNELRDQGVAVD